MQICNQLYFSKNSFILLLFLWLALPICGFSQSKAISASKKNIAKADSVINKNDSTLALSKKKDQIDAEIAYSARDSIVFLGNGTGLFYGSSDIKYKEINLKSEYVRIKMDSSTVYAHGKTDSTGQKIGEPVFTENKTEYNSKELTYNLKTRKAYIRQAVTKQGEGYIISDKTKKTGDDVLCITDGKYTTCDNHEHPDFYLDLTRGKVRPGKNIVAGPAYLVVLDVPLPIALPFGFFPFTDQYSSGILMPTFRDELTRGFGLTNGGYYFAINDYADMEFRGDIYTKGTWSVSANSNYVKKYKYRGSLSVSFREDVIGEKDLPDYSKSNNMSIKWSHSQDQRANPYFNFSSSVDFSTSGYNRSNINSYYNPNLNSENTKSSSISFTQRFPESPFSLSGSALVSQRTKDSTISMTLPSLNISMSRIYPFKRKNAVGNERWYEKISMSYSGTLSNTINTKESKLLTSSFSRDWKNGMQHSIPISASFNLFKYISINPSVNYNERWYLSSINKSWDKERQQVKIDTVSKFSRVYDFNMGVSASTKLYGTYTPLSSIFGTKIYQIRHVMTPSVGFSYTPDFGDPMWGYYGTYKQQVRDITNPLIYHDQMVQYSHYEGSLYGAPGVGKSGSINFSLSNNLEMKVRNDKDSTNTKKYNTVSLIDNFTISGGYNMAVDSMQWSTLSASIRLKLPFNFVISLGGAFDPYMYELNSAGNPVRVNKLRWQHGGLPKFLGTSFSPPALTISNETFKKKDKTKNAINTNTNNTENKLATKDEKANPDTNKDKKKTESDKEGYQKITIPWSLSVNYSIVYGNTSVFNKSRMDYDMAFTHNLSVNGNISLTNNWKITANSTYDFASKQFTYGNISVNRNLHCWNMSASIVPFGPFKSYNFHIGVNASMLQDLKYDKQSGYGTTPITWY
jgi:lipopolysaccharide assembly outer membrane protein LptD (OstA)